MNQVVRRPGDIAIFHFLEEENEAQSGEPHALGHCCEMQTWGVSSGLQTLKPPTFPPARLQLCPGRAVAPDSAAVAYSLREGLEGFKEEA